MAKRGTPFGNPRLFSFIFEWKHDNDLMVALQDELALQLESQKAQLDTLVIDRIEEPSANEFSQWMSPEAASWQRSR